MVYNQYSNLTEVFAVVIIIPFIIYIKTEISYSQVIVNVIVIFTSRPFPLVKPNSQQCAQQVALIR